MTNLAKTIFTSLSILCISNCSQKIPSSPPNPPPKVDSLIGRVAAIFPEKKYLLIEQYTSFDHKDGMIFYSRSANQQANFINVTGQKLGVFWIGDIKTNQFNIGDPVFMRHLDTDIPESSEVNPSR